MTISHNRTLVRINAPEFYKDPDFIRWLNHPGVATWHDKDSPPNEFSDVFFNYDHFDGSDAPVMGDDRPAIPPHIWNVICAELGDIDCLVWLSNLQE